MPEIRNPLPATPAALEPDRQSSALAPGPAPAQEPPLWRRPLPPKQRAAPAPAKQPPLGISADAINIRAGGDFRPDEAKLGPVFGRAFKEGWHMQCSVYPKGWKAAVERMHDEGEQERAEGGY